ncbi:RNB domain-containing ribonuclease [Saccharomonospora saliphila]|uniref:RNB domain-containing ribonuclease n=1 Tax=Saccharomonospora saliphila TaxID=369829 RepID=UPI000379FDBE|nr:RNB domain-containing ribonuclease [Saccharomonospora saliphila]
MALVAHGQGAGDFASLRAEFELPESFPPEVLAEADAVAGDPGDLGHRRVDATELPLVTVDPPGAKDLDQAVSVLSRPRGGFRVRYAIADLAAFVPPGGAVDAEARGRGQTLYLPDGNVGLHPPRLAEGAASLLPGVVRPAVLWTIDTDSDGEPTSVDVRRAWVRSADRLDYDAVAAAQAAGRPHPAITGLPGLGRLRRELAVRRGAVEPQLPEQRIGACPGGWVLRSRPRHEVEDHNAEISLLTGMTAASIMLEAGVGVLRTLPEADDGAIDWLRRSARALGIAWAPEATVSELLAGLDPARPTSLALYAGTKRLLRGAGYTAFDGEVPGIATHAGIGGPYAHVTAPIRRLVDRFGTEVCLAVTHGRPVPEWVREALGTLPRLMGVSDTRAARVERACLDQVEAWVLSAHVGRTFEAVVLRSEPSWAEVFVRRPPVLTRCAGAGLREGARVRVRLTGVDVDERRVCFERA